MFNWFNVVYCIVTYGLPNHSSVYYNSVLAIFVPVMCMIQIEITASVALCTAMIHWYMRR